MEQLQRTEVEQIQEDADTPDVKVEVEPDVQGAAQLHAEVEDMADSFNVNGFKCVHEKCGLVHGHDTTKHRASDSFDMSEDEAAQMSFNPSCHCALNELAHKGVADMTVDEANRKAPIPDETMREVQKL